MHSLTRNPDLNRSPDILPLLAKDRDTYRSKRSGVSCQRASALFVGRWRGLSLARIQRKTFSNSLLLPQELQSQRRLLISLGQY